jgi:hypothetical protein
MLTPMNVSLLGERSFAERENLRLTRASTSV